MRTDKAGIVEKTIHTAFTVTVIIAASKIAGFVREMVFAAAIGQNVSSDAYSTSYKLLNIITIAFAAGVASIFIPIYTKTRLKVSEERANLYASYILNVFMLFGMVLSVVGYIFAPQICGLIYQGSQEGLDLTIKLTRIMCPAIFFWAIAGVLTDLLNARKNFIPEQLIGFALTACVITAAFAFGSIESIAYATLVAAMLQVIIVLPFMKGHFHYKPKMNLKDKDLVRTFFLAIPALISIAFDEINALTDNVFASSLQAGAVTALARSFSLGQVVLGVLITPITTIMFTELSQFAALGQMDKLKETVRKSIEVIAVITLPIIALSVVCSSDIIGIVYQHGKFTVADTAFTAPVFTMYIIGIFGFGLRTFLIRVFYSMQMPRLPLYVGMFSVSLNIVLDLLLKGPMGAMGLTLATSIASFTGAMVMLGLLHQKIGKMNFRKSVGQFAKIFLATGVCLAAILAVHGLVPLSNTGFMANLVRLLLSAGVALGVYLLMSRLLRIDMANRAMRMLKQRFSRRQKTV
jgi:putative peptidoglycan lipid II flippase